MTKAIFFDVDDTLYNQIEPFSKAYFKNFNNYNIDVNNLFLLSREISDNLFEKSQNGNISEKEMQIIRIKDALFELGVNIYKEEAWKFQQDYENFQNDIKLSSILKNIFNYLNKKNVIIGIITNGPKAHQRKKIKNLELNNWIEEKNIFISSEVGISKPDKRIFDLALKNHKKIATEVYYVGDSFDNDVVGASQAGFKSIWVNYRKRVVNNHKISPDFVVYNETELQNIIFKIFI